MCDNNERDELRNKIKHLQSRRDIIYKDGFCSRNVIETQKEVFEIDRQLVKLEKELGTLNQKHALNDAAPDIDDWSTMYYNKKTETTETPSTECVHEFCDVYDYSESIPENIVEEAGRFPSDYYSASIDMLKTGKLTTKKYILTYCKVCGYTINRPCTE